MFRTVLAACLLPLLAACSSSATSSASGNDPADLLASRDGSSDVAAYRSALDTWAADCVQDRVTAAGYVDGTFSEEQKKHGPDTSRLETMRNLIASVPAGSSPTDCNSIAAAYLILVEKGR